MQSHKNNNLTKHSRIHASCQKNIANSELHIPLYGKKCEILQEIRRFTQKEGNCFKNVLPISEHMELC